MKMEVPSVVFISLILLTVANYVYGEESTLTSLLQANITETGVQDIKIQTTRNETLVEVDGTTTTTVNDNNTEIVKEMENSTSVITNSDKKNMNASETLDEEEVKMTSNDTRSENHSMTTTETTLIKNTTEVSTSTSSSQKPVQPTSARKPPEPSTGKKENSGSVLNLSSTLVILGFSILLLH